MYVTKLTEGDMLSCGITFKKDIKIAVGSEDFSYLKETFKDVFKFEGEVKPKRTPKATSAKKKE